jgi:hypothetical protein
MSEKLALIGKKSTKELKNEKNNNIRTVIAGFMYAGIYTKCERLCG